jgi:hypothetical protein
MNNRVGKLLWAVPLLGVALTVGLLAAGRPGPPAAAPEPAIGRFKAYDIPVGKFAYRLLFDTSSADFWVWTNGEWERPDPPRGGYPWKDIKGAPGRFQLLPQVPGELDAEMYVLDTATGKTWSRSVRNRAVLLAGEAWRQVPLPPPPGR